MGVTCIDVGMLIEMGVTCMDEGVLIWMGVTCIDVGMLIEMGVTCMDVGVPSEMGVICIDVGVPCMDVGVTCIVVGGRDVDVTCMGVLCMGVMFVWSEVGVREGGGTEVSGEGWFMTIWSLFWWSLRAIWKMEKQVFEKSIFQFEYCSFIVKIIDIKAEANFLSFGLLKKQKNTRAHTIMK